MARKPTHTLIVLHPDGTEYREFCAPTLERLQSLVGGWIETIGFFREFNDHEHGTILSRVTAYADEEGLVKDLPFNAKATAQWRRQYSSATSLCGPVVIQVKGDHTHAP